MQKHQRGFTLVELSIVLVILGLLIGGVLTGQSLIRAAELRSVATQEQRYIAATQTFRDKYFALPGDMTNATSYWGTATNCPGTSAQPSTTATTCNGDGNGKIDLNATANEWFRFWQHLANAGLIEGNYSGVTGGSNSNAVISANSPVGKISASIWYAAYLGSQTSTTITFDGQYDNVLQFGGVISNNQNLGSVLKPEDAYNIDAKLDDGKPATGRIVMLGYNTYSTCTDVSSSSALTANYLLTNAALSCGLIFRQAF